MNVHINPNTTTRASLQPSVLNRIALGLLSIGLFFSQVGCQSTFSQTPKDAPIQFLHDFAIQEGQSIAEAEQFNPLEASDSMIAFIEPEITKIRSPRHRARAIVRKLAEEGYYKYGYVEGLTQTAAQTFDTKQGNCLSFTHLYIALARLAGLDARYEVVDMPPTFTVSDGVLEHQVHIRVRVELSSRLSQRQHLNVDFNLRNSMQTGTVVSDDFAKSLHYSNDAVALWQAGKLEEAFIALSEGIRLTPLSADLWVNLATFYASNGESSTASEISRYALSLDPKHVIAMARVVAHASIEEANFYAEKLRRYQKRNPYYQFALAQRAEYQGNLIEALGYIDRALARKRNESEFHIFKAKLHTELGEIDQAINSYRRAVGIIGNGIQKESLLAKIDTLIVAGFLNSDLTVVETLSLRLLN